MNDRELLELAAKACRLSYKVTEDHVRLLVLGSDNLKRPWNPLAEDGDALRLAAQLKIDVCFYNGYEEVWAEPSIGDNYGSQSVAFGSDIAGAMRRAIVLVAVEIGRSMP